VLHAQATHPKITAAQAFFALLIVVLPSLA
jgi:hypothetical protein